MKRFLLFFACLSIIAFSFTSCTDDENDMASFDLSITGLEDLGPNAVYEGWIIVDGKAISTGIFTVNANGQLSKESFAVNKNDLDAASTFVLTIEPASDGDPAPSNIHILAGDFINNSAPISIDHPAALNNDFTSAAGSYILATPTDGSDNNEKSGIWFIDISSGSPQAGLDLPTLPLGWVYEGWAVINGVPVSTGTFSSANGADDSAPFSGSMTGPPFPGEDFVTNAPGNLTFPTDLSGGTAVISVEPSPDNSTNPFLLKPLVHTIPVNADDHVVFDLEQNLSFPTGTVTR